MAGDGVKAADVCLRILEYVAFEANGPGVTQIADAVGVAKSAAFKHLQTLIDHGFVTQEVVTTRYFLGPKAWLLSGKAPNLDDIASIAAPFMRAVRDDTGMAVVLSVPTPHSALVLFTCPSNQQIEIGVRPGSELALHASAQGKVFLAFGGEGAAISARTGRLVAVTPRTITDPAELLADIARVRNLGYATAPEQSLLGINAIAAPVYNYDNRLVGSIGLIGSIQHILAEPPEALVTRVLRLTSDVSAALGRHSA